MKSQKSGQIRMGETIAVLLIFFALAILAFFFFASIQAAGSKQQISTGLQERGIAITQIASYLPELQCSTDNAVKSFNCMDLEKVKAATGAIQQNRDLYTNMFGFAKISVEIVYPNPCPNPSLQCAVQKEYVLYDVSKPDFKSAEFFPVPVSLYEPQSQIYSFGVLKVTAYG
jgi:hypothetical protein